MAVSLGFLGGLALLVGGAELLVRGAGRLAIALGMSPLVVGLTVVAFATSAPELAVSVGSAVDGNADIALGNVVGSTIANVLLILGLSALVSPLVVRSQLVRFDVPVMIGAAIGVLVLALDGIISRLDGALLAAGIVGYLVRVVIMSRRSADPPPAPDDVDEVDAVAPSTPRDLLLVVAGLAGLVVGSNLLLDASVTVAERMGVSQLVIGLTLVAVGTSLPEIATSLLAVARGEQDLAVGNAVGSNVFNLLAVLGITALIAPGGIAVAKGALDFDLPVMVAVTVACLPIFFTGSRIARREGALFLGYYIAYTAYLLLDAAEHDALEPFSAVMLWFVVPLTVLSVGATVVGSIRQRMLERDASDRAH
jgi:cation:H+ antiporter